MESFGMHLRVILALLGVYEGDFRHMRVTLESLWSVFKKHPFSKSILMILCNSGVNLEPFWVHLGATRGLLGVYRGDFRSLLGKFWAT